MDNWCQWQSFTEATCDRAPLYLGNYEIALVDELWRYKKGRSRLIYIGKVYKPARTIRGRLREHLRATVRVATQAVDAHLVCCAVGRRRARARRRRLVAWVLARRAAAATASQLAKVDADLGDTR